MPSTATRLATSVTCSFTIEASRGSIRPGSSSVREATQWVIRRAAWASVAMSAMGCWGAREGAGGRGERAGELAAAGGGGALGDPRRGRGEDRPLDVEAGHQLGPGLVDLAEDGVLRGLDVGQVERVGLGPAHRLDRDD